MKYHKKKLGRLQQKILIYMINHDDHGFVKVSDLWSSLQLSQPTISKSAQSLVKYSYLKHGEYPGSLYLTDKGVAAAITLGVSYSELKSYVYSSLSYRPNPLTTRIRFVRGRRAILNYIRKIVNAYQNKQDFVMKQAVEYALENNYFENGNFRVLTNEEAQIFKLYIALKYIDEIGDWPTLKEFLDKYGLDKDFLRKQLKKRRQYIDSIIQELA
jgi:hypothetical protein